jgi:hypothetical protein
MNFQKINIQYSTRSNDKWNKNTGFKFASSTINRLCDTFIKCLCMSLCFQKPNEKCVLALAARIINKSQINYLASQKKYFGYSFGIIWQKEKKTLTMFTECLLWNGKPFWQLAAHNWSHLKISRCYIFWITLMYYKLET